MEEWRSTFLFIEERVNEFPIRGIPADEQESFFHTIQLRSLLAAAYTGSSSERTKGHYSGGGFGYGTSSTG
jgi:hypothetical protein